MITSRSRPYVAGALSLILLAACGEPVDQNTAQAPAPTQGAPAAPFAEAQPGDLRVFMSGALRPAVEQTTAQIQEAVGPMNLEVRQARLLQQTIEDGAAFDAAMLTTPVIEALAASGKIAPDSVVDLGDVPLGVIARGDISKVDISTPEALERTLLGATAIRRNYGVGATAPLIDHVFAELDVVDGVKDKVNPRIEGAPQLPEPELGPGEYELDLRLRTEIRPQEGWTLIGVVPDSLRRPNRMAAGVSPEGDTERAGRLMAFLRSDAFRKALADSGVDTR